MPLPWKEGDLRDELIRAKYSNLESPEWWRQFHLDGVLLYVWCLARYRPIVAAIHKAGIKSVLYQDCSSVVFPWNEWRLGIRMMWRRASLAHPGNPVVAVADFLLQVAKGHATVLHWPARRRLFDAADIVTFPYPAAHDAWLHVPGLLPHRIRTSSCIIPCPVAPHFSYDGTSKEPMVIAVGRWNDEEQKRGSLLLRTMEEVWTRHLIPFHIFGTLSPSFENWVNALSHDHASCVTLHGLVPNAQLVDWYRRAQISLCTSFHESTHISSAEAICCGCSVVAPPLSSVSCCQWYASESSGTIAAKDTPKSFADAVLGELSSWESGHRDPVSISHIWTNRLHATESARRILFSAETFSI